tara:strand:+ start:848 stop:1249 length:402 start_codon:yes stop_codon:yes gene_type:complete
MDWDSDPDLKKIRQDFIDSLSERLEDLVRIINAMNSGEVNDWKQLFTDLHFLAHKLAGTAESYGFSVLTLIGIELDDFLGEKVIHGRLTDDREILVPLIKVSELLKEALEGAIETNDLIELKSDPRLHLLRGL